MKEKVLKVIIYILGFFCLYIFIAVRILPLYNSLLVEKLKDGYWDYTKYGELYYFNLITHFREQNIPGTIQKHQLSSKQPKINDTEIFTFGDSFFDIARATQFPSELSEQMNKKVYFGYNDYPLQYLKLNGYTGKDEKVLIMGIVERFIPMKFALPHDTIIKTVDQPSKLVKTLMAIRDFIFYKRGEQMLEVLLKRSYFTTDAYSAISTTKFDAFGYIAKKTPVYSLDDTIPWLFVDDEVNGKYTSYYYHHSDAEMETICNNIDDLSTKLKKYYNINLVFLPIPAKYTLYHSIVSNDPYNNFIPRLEHGLSKRNIPYIDLFNEFSQPGELLYYGTDAHWNVKGLKKAVDITSEYLHQSNFKNLYK